MTMRGIKIYPEDNGALKHNVKYFFATRMRTSFLCLIYVKLCNVKRLIKKAFTSRDRRWKVRFHLLISQIVYGLINLIFLGTYCAPGKECRGGECVPDLQPPLDYYENDNWSEWKESPCRSNCLEKSKGVKVKRRSCKHGIRRTASCKGPYYNVVLCDDSILCTKNRTTASQLATNKCIQINNYLKHEFSIELESGPVVQVLHNVAEPWKACTVHCRKKDSPTLYALRFEMIGVNMNPYLPDGTWCHNKDGQDYYCRQHYCIPESYS